VLLLYKQLLRIAKKLPIPQSHKTINEIKSQFRSHRIEKDPNLIEKHIQKALDQISFLKMITPHSFDLKAYNSTHYVVRDGNIIQGHGEKKGSRVLIDNSLDPDDLKRHYKLLRRQHFMDRDK